MKTRMKNILVAIDFDENMELLLAHAAQLAKAFGAKVWLIHVAAPEPDFVGYEVGPKYIRDSRAEELREEHRTIQKYADNLGEQGIEAEGLLIQGATIEMLMNESRKLNIDLMIAGHHPHNFLYKAFVDDVSSQILKESKVPVLIIPLD